MCAVAAVNCFGLLGGLGLVLLGSFFYYFGRFVGKSEEHVNPTKCNNRWCQRCYTQPPVD